MTILYIALAIVPIVQVESRLTFAAKLSALVALTNAVGLLIYLNAAKRSALRSS
jgi:hypothetical protein